MIFTSNDLPLNLTTPVTSGEGSSESSVCAVSPSPRIRYPLVNCVTALLLVVKTALMSSVEAGDSLLTLAASSHRTLPFINVARSIPLPLLSTVSAQYFGDVYNAALHYVPSPFDLVNANIALEQYVTRVFELTHSSNCVLITACVYVDRLITCAPHLFVHSANVHKMFAVALMLAVKFHEDEYFNSQFFSPILGISVQELNQLEVFFLHSIGFHTFVGTEQFRDAQIALMSVAVHAPMGLAVLHTLRQREISDVAQACNAAKPWRVYAGSDGCGDFEDEMMVDCARVETQQTGAILSALAKVQLEHDLRRGGGQLGALTTKAVARLTRLQQLWQLQVVHDLVLPALESGGATVGATEGLGVVGFGSFLANGEGAGIWRYGACDGERRMGHGVVSGGGLGMGASIWSTRAEEQVVRWAAWQWGGEGGGVVKSALFGSWE